MLYLDVITKYYDKRDKGKNRKYYDTLDELFVAKDRLELVGCYIVPSWLGVKNIEITKETKERY